MKKSFCSPNSVYYLGRTRHILAFVVKKKLLEQLIDWTPNLPIWKNPEQRILCEVLECVRSVSKPGLCRRQHQVGLSKNKWRQLSHSCSICGFNWSTWAPPSSLVWPTLLQTHTGHASTHGDMSSPSHAATWQRLMKRGGELASELAGVPCLSGFLASIIPTSHPPPVWKETDCLLFSSFLLLFSLQSPLRTGGGGDILMHPPTPLWPFSDVAMVNNSVCGCMLSKLTWNF